MDMQPQGQTHNEQMRDKWAWNLYVAKTCHNIPEAERCQMYFNQFQYLVDLEKLNG